eukprot:3374169-Pyramimonas_sp.AAC.1
MDPDLGIEQGPTVPAFLYIGLPRHALLGAHHWGAHHLFWPPSASLPSVEAASFYFRRTPPRKRWQRLRPSRARPLLERP